MPCMRGVVHTASWRERPVLLSTLLSRVACSWRGRMSIPSDIHRLIVALAEAAGETPEWMSNRLRGMPLNELTALVAKLPAHIKAGLSSLPSLAALLGPGKWTPSPGPQTMAYESLADLTGYGGEPGGGKSQLLL